MPLEGFRKCRNPLVLYCSYTYHKVLGIICTTEAVRIVSPSCRTFEIEENRCSTRHLIPNLPKKRTCSAGSLMRWRSASSEDRIDFNPFGILLSRPRARCLIMGSPDKGEKMETQKADGNHFTIGEQPRIQEHTRQAIARPGEVEGCLYNYM